MNFKSFNFKLNDDEVNIIKHGGIATFPSKSKILMKRLRFLIYEYTETILILLLRMKERKEDPLEGKQ